MLEIAVRKDRTQCDSVSILEMTPRKTWDACCLHSAFFGKSFVNAVLALTDTGPNPVATIHRYGMALTGMFPRFVLVIPVLQHLRSGVSPEPNAPATGSTYDQHESAAAQRTPHPRSFRTSR